MPSELCIFSIICSTISGNALAISFFVTVLIDANNPKIDFFKSGSSVSFNSFIPKSRDLAAKGAKFASPMVLASTPSVSVKPINY